MFRCYEQYFGRSTEAAAPGTDGAYPQMPAQFSAAHCAYSAQSRRIQDALDALAAELAAEHRACLGQLPHLWDMREAEVLRRTFYLGYRCGLAQIAEIRADAPVKMTNAILEMEHGLGITRLQSEREMFPAGRRLTARRRAKALAALIQNSLAHGDETAPDAGEAAEKDV